MSKVVHKKLGNKSKFNDAPKWFIHKAESVLDNETHNSSGILRNKRIT